MACIVGGAHFRASLSTLAPASLPRFSFPAFTAGPVISGVSDACAPRDRATVAPTFRGGKESGPVDGSRPSATGRIFRGPVIIKTPRDESRGDVNWRSPRGTVAAITLA